MWKGELILIYKATVSKLLNYVPGFQPTKSFVLWENIYFIRHILELSDCLIFSCHDSL